MENTMKIVNAQYTKTAVGNVLTYLTELYETSLKEKVAIDSDDTAGSFRHASIWSIGSLAELHKAINNLHLVMDLQNKIISPNEEPVSPLDELRRKVAEVAKGGAAGSVTQTISRYKLVSTPDNDTYPESVNVNTKEVFETEVRKLEAIRSSGQVGVMPELKKLYDDASNKVPGLKKIYDEAVARGTMDLSFEDWLIHTKGRTENEFRHDEQEKEAKRLAASDNSPDSSEAFPLVPLDKNSSPETLKKLFNAAVELESSHPMAANGGLISVADVTPLEPSGALPKVVSIHDGPVPPKNSLAVLVGHESPLCEIFSPSPWFHQGRGTITVGSKDFSYYKDVDPTTKDGKTRATLPNAFYGGDGQPKWVLIRLKTCALLWDFKLDVENMSVYMAGVSDAKASEEPRWFKASELSASFSARLLLELNQLKEEIQ